MTNKDLKMSKRKKAKKAFQKASFSRFPPIVIASMGRSGSTLVFDSASEGLAKIRFPFLKNSEISKRLVTDFLWDPYSKSVRNGIVYKTHALGNEIPYQSKAKFIFVFGKASDAALSVISCQERYGNSWIERHLQHLRAKGKFEEIPYKDVLGFDDQIESWKARSDLDRLFINYEALWDHQDEISDFCGFPFYLPERKERSGNFNHNNDLVKQIRTTYHELDVKIAEMPNIQTLKSESEQ